MKNNIPQTDNFSGERYVSRQTQTKRRNRRASTLGWRFTIVRNYVRHDRGFRTFEEALAYKYKYLKEISPDSNDVNVQGEVQQEAQATVTGVQQCEEDCTSLGDQIQ